MPSITPQISFGGYTFPLTFQEDGRTTKLSLDKKHVPFNWGDHAPPNSSLAGRDISIKGPIGSLVVGSGGNTLQTADDLEAERRLLAALQVKGRQPLQVGDLQFCMAYLEQFDHKFFQDAFGFRFADWNLKFWADDPRYYSVAPTSTTRTTTDFNPHLFNISTAGNVRTYPVCTFTGLAASGVVSGGGPFIGIKNGGQQLQVSFSKLTLKGGDTLVIDCDPRPNKRSIAAIYTPSGSSVGINALQYTAVTDFANNYDLTEFFPFLDPIGGLQFLFGVASGPANYSLQVAYYDRWI